LGSPDYWRLRLGIGHPGVKHEVAAYVLRKPPQSEREAIFKCIGQALDATELLLAGDTAKATAQIHAQPQRPKPPRKVMPAAAPAAMAAPRAHPAPPTQTSPLHEASDVRGRPFHREDTWPRHVHSSSI